MEFEIKRIITNEYSNGSINLMLNDFEDFINQRLLGLEFGPSVTKYFWGFELYRFDGAFAQFFSNDIESWKYSRKWLVTNSHFDWNIVKGLNKNELIQELKKELLAAINRIETMKRKPKEFNNLEFKHAIEKIIADFN